MVLKTFPFRTIKRKVWLITWEYTRKDYFEHLRRRKIAAILDSRVSGDFVDRFLPLLYSCQQDLMNFEILRDMYLQSRNRRNDPDWKEVNWDQGHACFGGHPWLAARVVEGFFVDVINTEFEISYWTELERYKRTPEGGLRQVQGKRRFKLETRESRGKLDERVFFDEDAVPPTAPRVT